MYLQKVMSIQNVLENLFFVDILKVNDKNSRIWIQDPDPYPLVRGMDPRFRTRIHTKMSWIRNIAIKKIQFESSQKRNCVAPQFQFPHSCICERFIYFYDWSTYFPASQ
jgi:hypothetical protein